MIQVLLYQSHITDTKHNVEFDKDKVSYRHKTFDAVLSKKFREQLTAEMVSKKLSYPIALELDNENYFTKNIDFTRADGTSGVKTRITLLGAKSISQGVFENKSLDDIIDEYEAISDND